MRDIIKLLISVVGTTLLYAYNMTPLRFNYSYFSKFSMSKNWSAADHIGHSLTRLSKRLLLVI